MSIQVCSRFTRLVAALVAAAGVSMTMAQAQPGAAQPEGAPPAAADTTAPLAKQAPVTDEKLEQFAKVAADVHKIQQDYVAKAQTLQKATEQEIVASVEDGGMTVAEFTALVERVQSDPTLARRLTGLQGP